MLLWDPPLPRFSSFVNDENSIIFLTPSPPIVQFSPNLQFFFFDVFSKISNNSVQFCAHSFTHSNTPLCTPIINHSFFFLLFAHNIQIFEYFWITFHNLNNIWFGQFWKNKYHSTFNLVKRKYLLQHCFKM